MCNSNVVTLVNSVCRFIFVLTDRLDVMFTCTSLNTVLIFQPFVLGLERFVELTLVLCLVRLSRELLLLWMFSLPDILTSRRDLACMWWNYGQTLLNSGKKLFGKRCCWMMVDTKINVITIFAYKKLKFQPVVGTWGGGLPLDKLWFLTSALKILPKHGSRPPTPLPLPFSLPFPLPFSLPFPLPPRPPLPPPPSPSPSLLPPPSSHRMLNIFLWWSRRGTSPDGRTETCACKVPPCGML